MLEHLKELPTELPEELPVEQQEEQPEEKETLRLEDRSHLQNKGITTSTLLLIGKVKDQGVFMNKSMPNRIYLRSLKDTLQTQEKTSIPAG